MPAATATATVTATAMATSTAAPTAAPNRRPRRAVPRVDATPGCDSWRFRTDAPPRSLLPRERLRAVCDARLTVLPPFAQVLITGLHNLEVNMHEVRAPPQSFACVMLFDDRDASSRARALLRALPGAGSAPG